MEEIRQLLIGKQALAVDSYKQIREYTPGKDDDADD